MNTENRIKEIENLLNGCITNEICTYTLKDNVIVHKYLVMGFDGMTAAGMCLRNNGYEPVNTHSSYCFDMFNENTLSNVSYCEGDFMIVVFDTLEDFNKHKQSAIEFYQNN